MIVYVGIIWKLTTRCLALPFFLLLLLFAEPVNDGKSTCESHISLCCKSIPRCTVIIESTPGIKYGAFAFSGFTVIYVEKDQIGAAQTLLLCSHINLALLNVYRSTIKCLFLCCEQNNLKRLCLPFLANKGNGWKEKWVGRELPTIGTGSEMTRARRLSLNTRFSVPNMELKVI